MTREERQFLEQLIANRSVSTTLSSALWKSRLAIFQWVFIFAVLALVLYQYGGFAALLYICSAAFAALIVQISVLNRSVKTWPVLDNLIDWNKVQSLLQQDAQPGA